MTYRYITTPTAWTVSRKIRYSVFSTADSGRLGEFFDVFDFRFSIRRNNNTHCQK